MFYKLKRFINGCHHVSIEGLNLDRALASLLGKGIVMEDIRRPSHRLIECKVSDKMLQKLIVSLDPLCYTITIKNSSGLKQSFSTLRKRLGLLAGLLILIVGVSVYSSFVWKVTIEGEVTVPTQQILEKLKEGGVFVGAAKSAIDRNAAADILNNNLGEASLVTIELKGTSAIIKIKERIMPPVPPENEDLGNDLVAAMDCVIESITALSGTPKVKPGQIVKRGEVLIAGYAERYEGSTLVKDEVKADGLVWGEVMYSTTKFFALERVEYVRTGEHKDVTIATAFGREFGKKDYKPPYALYETETEPPVAMCMLPVRFTLTKYYELTAKLVVLNEEEVLPQYKREMVEETMLMVPKNVPIKASYTSVTKLENTIKIDAIVKTRQIISTRI